MADFKKLQQDGEEFSPVTHEAAVLNDDNESIAVSYQTAEDDNLNTDDKSIVGAINEVSTYGVRMNDLSDVIEPDDPNNPIMIRIEELEDTLTEYIESLLDNLPSGGNETDPKKVLYNMMLEDGYNEATRNMTVDELIQLLDDSQINVNEIKQIACGYNFTYILKNDGSIWACGTNAYGELGLGDRDTSDHSTFTQVTNNINNDVKQIACGYAHTFIIKNDGSVWACGLNDEGQLGLGDETNRYQFTQVTTNINNDVNQIVCGEYYTVILKNDGSVWSCGYNTDGQLGLNDTTSRTSFTKVTTNINNDVKQIACGRFFTAILKNDGSVWVCGDNYYGQLGLGDTTDRTIFTNINNDVSQIACGKQHTIILKNDGSLWACGYNANGQLGLGTTTTPYKSFTQVTTNVNNVKQIIGNGQNHTFIIKNDGSVWSCGQNDEGQLGLSNNTSPSVFTHVTTNINNDVKQIACGYNHTFIIKNDGTVWSTGYNYKGALGLGDSTADRNTFTQVPLSSQPIDEDEINRLKLYYYLLDNSISVTEDMDVNTMLDLLINNDTDNLNDEHYNNLKSVLIDEGVEVTEEDNMASLITKVDEEFDRKNANSGLDIISATELPATGEENQICVITNNPVDDYVISPLNSDKTDSTVIFGQLTNLESPSTVTVNSGGITQKYCFLKFSQDTNVLISYIYKNGQWVQFTKEILYLIKDCVHVTDTTAGGLYFNSTSSTYYPNMSSSSGMRMYSATAIGKTWITTYNKVNLNNFDTVKIRIANFFQYDNVKISIFRSDARYHNYGSSNPTYYSTLVTTTLTTSTAEYYDYDLDISTWTGEYYLGIMLTGSNGGTDCYVSDFYLYNKE